MKAIQQSRRMDGGRWNLPVPGTASQTGRGGEEQAGHVMITKGHGSLSWKLANVPDSAPKWVKCFQNLLQEYQEQGRCRRCGGCATFCATMKYNALEMGKDGYPRYADPQRCTQCGLCYAVCSANNELKKDVREMLSWEDPSGRVLGVGLYRARDGRIRTRLGNGGALTALLFHLLEKGVIDGALVPLKSSEGNGYPLIVEHRQDIELHSKYFQNPGLGSLIYSSEIRKKKNFSRRLCFVGNSCQILSLRKMEYLGVMPAESFALKIGIFCNTERSLSQDGNGCALCSDHFAGYADVAISDYAVRDDFSAVIVRTSLGMMAMSGAAREVLENYGSEAAFA